VIIHFELIDFFDFSIVFKYTTPCFGDRFSPSSGFLIMLKNFKLVTVAALVAS